MQLAIPRVGENAARGFYAAKLGIPEVRQPPLLAVRVEGGRRPRSVGR